MVVTVWQQKNKLARFSYPTKARTSHLSAKRTDHTSAVHTRHAPQRTNPCSGSGITGIFDASWSGILVLVYIPPSTYQKRGRTFEVPQGK